MAGRKMVIWLEESPETVSDKMAWLEQRGYQVKDIATAFELKDFLEENSQEVAVIITGRVIRAIKNLDYIDIPNADTDLGLNAGFVIIGRFLRGEESPYAKIPVLMVATTWNFSSSFQATLMNNFRNRKGHGSIGGIKKYAPGGFEEFKKIFKYLANYWNTLPAWQDVPQPGDYLPTE